MGSCTNYCSNCTDDTKEIKTAEVKGTTTTPFKKAMHDDVNPAMMGGDVNHFNQYQSQGLQNNSFNRSMNHMMQGNYSIDPNQDFGMEHEQPDENGRVVRGRITLKNGAIYEG